jgi:cephalosporin hydroxylase
MSDSGKPRVGLRHKLMDAARSISFHLRPFKKRRLYQARARCATPHDYYVFARKVFRIGQIEQEITGFLELAKSANPTTVVEIGMNTAGNSFFLSQALPNVEMFVGLDMVLQNWNRLLRFARPGQKLDAFVGSSYDPQTVERVGQHLNGRPVDVLFIDGDHRYQGVRDDFLAYRKFVRPGGIIAFHDICTSDDLSQAASETVWAGDVPQLWQRLRGAYTHHDFIARPNQQGFGIGALIYDPQAPLPEL